MDSIKKSFSSITITELCRRAGINRGTFYIHYIDMDDLLDDLLADFGKENYKVQAVIDELIRGGFENIINHPTFSRQDPLPVRYV